MVRAAQDGSIDAFQRLYDGFIAKILSYLFRMTGSKDVAEDLAQDTFVLAYRKLGSLRDPALFQSWLFRIAQNNVYQRFRSKKAIVTSIDAEGSEELSDVQKLATPLLNPEDAVMSEELQKVVERAIGELSEKYRAVFVLSAIQKLSYSEISEILGRSLGSVKSDIHRARVTVRDKIKEYLGANYGMSRL